LIFSSLEEANKLIDEYVQALEEVKIKAALKSAMSLSSLGNQYLQHNKPWDLVKNDDTKARGGSVTTFAGNLVIALITLLEPYMPAFTQKVLDQLKLDKKLLDLSDPKFKILLPVGHEIGDPQPLFAKIDDAKIAELRSKYAGSAEIDSKEDQGVDSAFPLELVVGKVVEVSAHPAADHLYVLDVSFGDSTRKIVSGLVKYYTIEKLLNRFVIVVSNLKAANFKGVKSHGMVLCAQSGENMGILTLSDDSSNLIGSRVFPADIPSTGKEKFALLDSKKLKSALKGANFSVDSTQAVFSNSFKLSSESNAHVIAENVSSGAQIL
jgi:methionyl-tRNA synthetase